MGAQVGWIRSRTCKVQCCGLFAMKLFASVAACVSFAQVDATFVDEHGRLSLGGQYGTQIVDEHGSAVQLRGISTFNPPWFENCGQKDAFCYMANTLGATMVRIAMDANNQHWDWVDEASGCGLYVLIDYHYVGKRPIADDNAKNFFKAAAQRYSSYNNVMYELFNEPDGVSWSDIKSYCEEILSVLRPIDPLAIVVCGTPHYSSSPGDVVGNMIDGDNIMYTKHFYAASHHDQDQIGALLTKVPIFVTEWGICTYSGDGNLDYGSAEAWQNMLDGGNAAGVWVSWANWGWNDKGESCSYLNQGSCDAHNWASHSSSGSHVDGYFKRPGPPSGPPSPPTPPAPTPPAPFPAPGSAKCGFACSGGCGTCTGWSESGYCVESQGNCEGSCGGKWCSASGSFDLLGMNASLPITV